MENDQMMKPAEQVVIIELEIDVKKQILLQSILQGEEGIGVIRSFDQATGRQQLWTTPSQRADAYAWLNSLPDSLDRRVTGEWLWRSDGGATAS